MYSSTLSLTSVLDVWVVNATPRPLHYRRLCGHQGRSGRVRKISLAPGFDPRTVQTVAGFCTDWAIPAHLYGLYNSPNVSASPVEGEADRGACGARWRKRNAFWVVLQNVKARDCLANVGVGRNMIFKSLKWKWTGLEWLRIGSSGWILWRSQCIFWANSWPAKELLASEEELCSMGLVIWK
jgi:hypothetical protein